jgi:hypothetical protein
MDFPTQKVPPSFKFVVITRKSGLYFSSACCIFMFFRFHLTPFPKVHLKLEHSINLMQKKLILGERVVLWHSYDVTKSAGILK